MPSASFPLTPDKCWHSPALLQKATKGRLNLRAEGSPLPTKAPPAAGARRRSPFISFLTFSHTRDLFIYPLAAVWSPKIDEDVAVCYLLTHNDMEMVFTGPLCRIDRKRLTAEGIDCPGWFFFCRTRALSARGLAAGLMARCVASAVHKPRQESVNLNRKMSFSDLSGTFMAPSFHQTSTARLCLSVFFNFSLCPKVSIQIKPADYNDWNFSRSFSLRCFRKRSEYFPRAQRQNCWWFIAI